MKTQRSRSAFFPILFAASLLLTVISVVSYVSGAASFIGNAVGVLVTPLSSAVYHINGAIDGLAEYLVSIDDLKKENEELARENMQLKLQLRSDTIKLEENEFLSNFLDLKRERAELSFIDANIITRDVGTVLTFTLDKGSASGVKSNMAIINEDGLVGVITEVGLNFSKAISIINQTGSVGVKIERTGESAILSGSFSLYAEGLCRIDNLDSGLDIRIGDKIYTSGIGSVYPEGFLVGEVTNITPDPVTYTVSAAVKPAVDLTKVRDVMIVSSGEFIYE